MTEQALLNLCETIRAELLPQFPEVADIKFLINNRYRSRGGACRLGTAEVKLASFFYTKQSRNDDNASNTIRHEMAHYVAWQRFRVRGHCGTWRSVARSMGCNGERCHSSVPLNPITLTCSFCNNTLEVNENEAKRVYRSGRVYRCNQCKRGISFPWEKQIVPTMPKRILTQQGLDRAEH